jgi:hypothetical protein
MQERAMMMMSMFGSGSFGRSFSGRMMAAYFERTGFWSGALASAGPTVAAQEHMITDGLIAGTLVATETGWLPVEELRRGDRVVTFDHGLQPLRAISHARLVTRTGPLPRAALPLAVPALALGNRRAMTLLPEQAVLIESDRAEELYGDPFTLIPAAALDGHAGITRTQPQAETDVIFAEFENDELVYAEGMVLAYCPRREAAMVTTPDELIGTGTDCVYPQLPRSQARALLASMSAG